MKTTHEEIARWADSHESSKEIARAILEIATDEEQAEDIWEQPEYFGVVDQVSRRAFELAGGDAAELHWGISTLTRDGFTS
jgi:hypothetical protein